MSAKKKKPSLTLHKLDWLEVTSIIIGLWFIFFPKPYTLLFTLCLLIPLIGLLLNGIRKPSLASLISIGDEHERGYDLADFIVVPGLALMVRLLSDFEFESFYSILVVGTVGFTIVMIFLFSTHAALKKYHKKKWLIYVAVIGNLMLYSYAGTYGVNCVYDFSEPKIYDAEVVDKYITTSTGRRGVRHTHYYLRIAPWGHHRDYESISVSGGLYRDISPGEKVQIDYRQGLFGIAWYYIDQEHTFEL